MIFFLFRHGETDWNLATRFQGHADIPLNARGLEQARLLAPLLCDCRLDAILSSDLARAAVTGEIANAELGLPIAFDAGLREIDVGAFSGRTREELMAELGQDFWSRWASVHAADLDLSLPGGESKRQQLERGQASLLRAQATFSENTERVGICTHGGMIRRLVHACEGAPATAIPLPNACVYRIEFRDGVWRFGARVDGLVAPDRSVFE